MMRRQTIQKLITTFILITLCMRMTIFWFSNGEHRKRTEVEEINSVQIHPYLSNLIDSEHSNDQISLLDRKVLEFVVQKKTFVKNEIIREGSAAGTAFTDATDRPTNTKKEKQISIITKRKHTSTITDKKNLQPTTKKKLQKTYIHNHKKVSYEMKNVANTINPSTIIPNGKVNVYTYHDVFTDHDNLNLYWNPLFPHIPRRGYFATKLEDDDWIQEIIARRFVGYLHANKSGYYTFKFDSSSPLDFLLFNESFSKDHISLRLGQLSTGIQKSNVFRGVSKEIWLEQGKAYPIDLIHSCIGRGRFSLRWKNRNWPRFAAIGFCHLSSLHSNTSVFSSQPDSYVYTGCVPKLRRKFQNDSRMHFGSKIQLTSKSSKTGLETCAYKPSYLFLGNKLLLYYGQQYLKKEKIYPNDHANYKADDVKMNRFLGEDTAKAVANDVFAAVNNANSG